MTDFLTARPQIECKARRLLAEGREMRSASIEAVDSYFGYSVEYAASPAWHRSLWDDLEERLALTATNGGGRQMKPDKRQIAQDVADAIFKMVRDQQLNFFPSPAEENKALVRDRLLALLSDGVGGQNNEKS